MTSPSLTRGSYDEELPGDEDYAWARDTIRSHALEDRVGLLLSTAFGMIEPDRVVEWMLKDKVRARFQLQLHKYIWPPDARAR